MWIVKDYQISTDVSPAGKLVYWKVYFEKTPYLVDLLAVDLAASTLKEVSPLNLGVRGSLHREGFP